MVVDDIPVITLAHGIRYHSILTHDYYGTKKILDDYNEIMRINPKVSYFAYDTKTNRIVGI